MAQKVRYNRASLDDACYAAARLETKPLYVFATYHGFTIAAQPPRQQYCRVDADGSVTAIAADGSTLGVAHITR